jgi:opacity protein-like surface antigen
MQLNPLPMTLPAFKPQPVVTPTAQAAVLTASLASQTAAAPTRTQTVNAPQAAGKTDSSKAGQSGTDTGQSKDTLAGATFARTNGTGYGLRHRGSQLDVSV